MDGVLILNTTAVSDSAGWVLPTGLALGIIGLITFFIMIDAVNETIGRIFASICVISILCALGLGILSKDHWRVNERNQYECVIDNDVSIVEIYKNYNVIEQRGNIWILEDKTE